jgi:hypothetical protein
MVSPSGIVGFSFISSQFYLIHNIFILHFSIEYSLLTSLTLYNPCAIKEKKEIFLNMTFSRKHKQRRRNIGLYFVEDVWEYIKGGGVTAALEMIYDDILLLYSRDIVKRITLLVSVALL